MGLEGGWKGHSTEGTKKMNSKHTGRVWDMGKPGVAPEEERKNRSDKSRILCSRLKILAILLCPRYTHTTW